MRKLILLILLYWVILIENGTDWVGILFDFGNGLEIRLSLILKISFLVLNLAFFLGRKPSIGQFGFLFHFMFFLLCSTLYVGVIHPKYFLQALSVNLHIQLGLNIIMYLYWARTTESQLIKFYDWLRFFALVNAILVIISFFFPYIFSNFESSTGIDGTRAFGLLGDEIASFLSFFFFDALIFRNYKHAAIYSFAVLCTGSIGAFIIFVVLFGYFFIKYNRKSRYFSLQIVTGLLLAISGFFIFSDNIQELTVVKRVVTSLEAPEEGSISLRMLSLKTAFESIKERPYLGAGYGSYAPAILEKTEKSNLGPSNIISSAYNPYVQMLAEAGLAGLIFFIMLLRQFLKKCQKWPRRITSFVIKFKIATRGWLFVFFITGLSANWFLPSSFIFLLVVTLVGINMRLNKIGNE